MARLECFTAVFLSFLAQSSATIGCIGNSRKPVDWFSAYKLPKIGSESDPLIQAGVGLIYLDEVQPKWAQSKSPVNVSNQAIGFTLDQIYNKDKDEDVAYLMYNDEAPDGSKHDNRGHLKGVVAFGAKQGFWLVHSTPKFPPKAGDGYSYPESGHDYGQTFLCITLKGDYFNKIAKQLLVSWPEVYDFNIPKSSPYADDPDLQLVVKGKHNDQLQSMFTLPSVHNQKFVTFAKNKEWGRDLYTDWIAPYFKSSLYTETWQNGRGSMTSNCSTAFKVENIRDISLPFSIKFPETKDHSKWTVTNSKGIKWICIGDINRQESQMHRGGGTVCTDHSALWGAFSGAVAEYEHCPADDDVLRFIPGL